MPQFSPSQFGQFFAARRDQKLTDAQMLINLSQRNVYVLPSLVRGKTAAKLVKPSGTGVEETVFDANNGSFKAFNPGDAMVYGTSARAFKARAAWRQFRSDVKWTDTEYNRATNGGDGEKVKDFRKIKEQERVTSWANGADALVFARPNGAEMEVATAPANSPGTAFSLPAFICEGPTGVPSSSPVVTTQNLPVGWGQTTLFGLNPVEVPRWHNLQVAYDDGNIAGTAGLIEAFDTIMLQLRVLAHPDAGDLMQSRDASELMCFSTSNGVNLLKRTYREKQDRWVNPKDPAMDFPTFDGVSVMWAPQLDTELLGLNGAKTAYSGNPYAAGRPRYFLANRKYVHVCTDGAVGDMQVLPRSAQYPDTQFVVTSSTIQILCNHRFANGIIVPGSNTAD